MLHNQRQLNLRNLRALYEATKPLADYVVPQEYGITEREKRKIAVRVCRNLVSKILRDIEMATGRGGNADFAEQLYRYARPICAGRIRCALNFSWIALFFACDAPGWTRGSPTPSRSARRAAASARGSISPPSRTSTRCSTYCGSGVPTSPP